MEAPRPTPRQRGATADSIPITQLKGEETVSCKLNNHFHQTLDLTAIIYSTNIVKTQPVPRPRQHTTSGGHQDSMTDEEDIYTDNSPLSTSQPTSRKVSWGDNASHVQGYKGVPPQSIGFASAHTQSVPVGMNNTPLNRVRMLFINNY